LWGDLVTRKNPIGDHNVINTATPEKMMVIKGKYYHPNNSLLVICGDVKPDDAFAKAENIFGSWGHSGFDPNEKYPIPDFAPLQSTQYFVKESSIAQTPYMLFFWQGPDTRNDSASTIAGDVFNTILGLNSSKWQQALVDKGLATYAGVSYQTLKYVGPINIYLMPNPLKLKECHEEVIKQIKMWTADDYYTDEQLTTAKLSLQRSFIRQTEKPSSLASQLTYYWCSTSYEYFTDYINNYTKVTREDIKNYLEKYIVNKNFVAGTIINAEMNKASKVSTFFKP
jgi:zinc protease